MKYFSLPQIQEAMRLLRPHHAIFATTFFVLKKQQVPVGSKIHFQLDSANKAFLNEHYRIHPKSLYFFRVMRQNNPRKDWNDPGYAGKGLQSVNTRGVPAFIHDTNDNTWGWTLDYVQRLGKVLPSHKKVPLYDVAVWFYRERGWPEDARRADVVNDIINEYHLTGEELAGLFDVRIDSQLSEEQAFQAAPVKWHQILEGSSVPKDVPPENSGILTFLEASYIGPAPTLRFEPHKRLNLITGDNGLGKTFLLDLCWWALTRNWAERTALPLNPQTRKSATIKYIVAGREEGRVVKATYNANKDTWEIAAKLNAISGLVIYARVDGSFAVWDPANQLLSSAFSTDPARSLTFSSEEVWNGKEGKIEGLLRDWVSWQDRQDRYPSFQTFQNILKRVSPPDMGPLKIGEPIRIPGDVRPIPTLAHSFGTVPILFESAGIKRIITLAYLIVWAWQEHKIQSKQVGKKEERQMVVLVDEAEAHLHPKWQRVLLPALLGVASDLHSDMAVQLFVATHSPLVLASSEPVYDPLQDTLYHLDMSASGNVELRALPFELRGGIDSWLSSAIFQIGQPGSGERETAIMEAIRLQNSDNITTRAVEEASEKLRAYLAPEDPFWIRWLLFAEQHHVKL